MSPNTMVLSFVVWEFLWPPFVSIIRPIALSSSLHNCAKFQLHRTSASGWKVNCKFCTAKLNKHCKFFTKFCEKSEVTVHCIHVFKKIFYMISSEKRFWDADVMMNFKVEVKNRKSSLFFISRVKYFERSFIMSSNHNFLSLNLLLPHKRTARLDCS